MMTAGIFCQVAESNLVRHFEKRWLREVEEETGLTLAGATLLGFIHFHHLTPKPEPFPYPYPDMIHLVYAALATGTIRSGDSDGWEKATYLMSPQEAASIDGMGFGLAFLRGAASRL